MTPNPVTATPDEDRQSAMVKMQEIGCRHLPVVVDDTFVDMLSMRDLLFVELEARDQEIQALRGYIQGDY
jgi:CBS domain-containing protein